MQGKNTFERKTSDFYRERGSRSSGELQAILPVFRAIGSWEMILVDIPFTKPGMQNVQNVLAIHIFDYPVDTGQYIMIIHNETHTAENRVAGKKCCYFMEEQTPIFESK